MTDLEKNRLTAVRQFEQLDFSKNKELDDLVTLASEICNVPIALLTLMDEDTQWIKCRLGVDITQNSRENSFCKHLIDVTDVFVVEDTLKDDRFEDHVLVTGETNIRFYAGAPLISSTGFHLGTLCVFDQTPHEFTPRQKEMLAILSNQATHLMELEISLKLNAEYINEINSQNNSLLSIAHIQSHGYRKPVASILGLMNLIKAENYFADKECLLMMELAVNELDEKIRDVVKCTENTMGFADPFLTLRAQA